MSSNYRKKTKKKRVLDGVELNKKKNVSETKDFDTLIKEIRKDIIEDELKEGKKITNKEKNNKQLNKENKTKKEHVKKKGTNEENNIHDTIQSIISILFTIVIFILILVLIIILYNKYLKKDKDIDLDNLCSSYIKKDLVLDQEDIINYVINSRHIIYNIDEYDSSNITNKTINEFSKFIIWDSESEYSYCDDSEYCLDTKKEINYNILKNELEYYLNIDNLNLAFDYNFEDSDITRLYKSEDKVVLTFKSMEYSTLKHDIVDIRIEENRIYIIFALSKKIDDINYAYTGSKKVELEYTNNNYILKMINTKLN